MINTALSAPARAGAFTNPGSRWRIQDLPEGQAPTLGMVFIPSLLWNHVGSEAIPLTLLEPTLFLRRFVPCVQRQTEGLSALLPSRAVRSLRVLRSGCSHPLISPLPSTHLPSQPSNLVRLITSPFMDPLLVLPHIPGVSSLHFHGVF